jgi:hypothetical protein
MGMRTTPFINQKGGLSEPERGSPERCTHNKNVTQIRLSRSNVASSSVIFYSFILAIGMSKPLDPALDPACNRAITFEMFDVNLQH